MNLAKETTYFMLKEQNFPFELETAKKHLSLLHLLKQFPNVKTLVKPP